MRPIALVLVPGLLAACSPPDATGCPCPDKSVERLLIDLATEHASVLFPVMQAGAEAELGSLYQLTSGEEYSGRLILPDDDPEALEGDTALRAPWRFEYEYDEYGMRTWDWRIELTLDGLQLDEQTISSFGTWEVWDEVYDYHRAEHAWSGVISIDGAEEVSGRFSAVWMGNLHRVEGRIGDTLATWENDNPDQP